MAREKMRDAGALGTDATIRSARGERQFASGDRIIFLRNERELGVKNGTLGKVEMASPQNMAVRTDDGREIAFDTKDYAHIDHGYAATIHKAQGMTVDRAHVLEVNACLGNARMPMAETHWSLGFAQTHHRDHLYAWMLAQADRWQDWFTIAREQRSGALTEHLLTLFIAQDCEEREI